jgi:hypothetical protein
MTTLRLIELRRNPFLSGTFPIPIHLKVAGRCRVSRILPFSTHSWPESGRLRLGRSKQRVLGALQGVPKNACQIAETGVAPPASGGTAWPGPTAKIPPRGVCHVRRLFETSNGRLGDARTERAIPRTRRFVSRSKPPASLLRPPSIRRHY